MSLLFTDDRSLGERLARRLQEEDGEISIAPPTVVSPDSDLGPALAADVDLVFLHLPAATEPSWPLLAKMRGLFPRVPLLVLLPAAAAGAGAEALSRGADEYLLVEELGGPALTRAIRYARERRQLKRELDLMRERLFAEPQRPLEELAVLHAVASAGAAAESEDVLLEEVTRILGKTLYPDNFGVLLLDEREGVLLTHASYQTGENERYERPIPLGTGVSGQVALTGRPWRIGDVRQIAAYIELDPQTRSELCVPIKSGEQLLGVVNAESCEPHAFSEADERLLLTFASQVATAIARLRLVDAERRRLQEAETVREAAAALTATLDLNQVLDLLLVHLEKVIPFDSAEVFLVEENVLRVVSSHGLHADPSLLGRTFPADSPLVEALALGQEPILIRDVRADARFENWGNYNFVRGWMVVPLTVAAEMIGCFTLNSKQVGAYGAADARLAQTFANQASIAVKNAGLFKQTETNLAEMRALHRVGQRLIATASLPDLLQSVVDNVAAALPAERVMLVTVDMEARRLLDYVADRRGTLPLGSVTFDRLWEGLTGWVLREGKPALSPKGVLDQRESEAIRRQRRDNNRGAVIVVPLPYRTTTVGTLTAINAADGPDFTQRHLDLMVAMANQVAVAIVNARLFDETHRRAEELGALVEISTAVRVAEGTAEIMEIVLDTSLALFGTDRGAITIPDDSGERLRIAQHKNWPAAMHEVAFPLDGSLFGYVFTSRQPYLAEDLRSDPLVDARARTMASGMENAPRAAMYAPLLAGKVVIGIIALTDPRRGAFTAQDLRLLTTLAEIAGSALHRAGLMETLEQRVAARTRELAAANERLQELDRLKSKFVSDVSHELRTPITNLSLYMDLIEHGKAERSQRYWSVLRKQAERLSQLIEDILNLSRLELGRLGDDFAVIDFNQLLAETLSEYRPELEAAGLALHFAPDEELPLVWGQREQLLSVVANLLDNAVNYTPAGEVRVRTIACGEQACLIVEDTGVGIAAEDLPHVFERFYRGHHAGQSNIPGTGLGLAIVHEVVSLHHGHVELASIEGEGTRVQILLPSVGRAVPDQPQGPTPSSA